MKMLPAFLAFICIPIIVTAQKTLEISTEAIATIKLDGYPDFLAIDGDDVWITNTGKVQKLSAKTRKVILSVDVPEPCGAPVVAEGSLWIANCKDRSVYRIDRQTGKTVSIIPVNISDPGGEISLAFGAGSVWILSDSIGVLSRIDPKTNKVQAQIKVNKNSYCAAFGFNSVWITTSEDRGYVQRIDPGTNSVTATIAVGPNPRFLAAGANGVFTLNQTDGTVSHIDPASNRVVATIASDVPGTGGDIAVGAGKVWVRAKFGTFLLSVDPKTNQVLNRYSPLCGSGGVRVSDKYVWVTAHDINTIWLLRL